MNDRLLMFAGSVLAGILWIGLLTLALWAPEPRDDRLLADLLLDLYGSFPYPLTIQNVMWLVFFVGAGELLHRHLQGRGEGKQLAKQLLPEDEVTVLSQKDLGAFYRKIRSSDPEEKYWLQRLLKSAILQFQASGSTDQANAIFNANVELYHHEIELRYNLLRYLVWLIPTLGFIWDSYRHSAVTGSRGIVILGGGGRGVRAHRHHGGSRAGLGRGLLHHAAGVVAVSSADGGNAGRAGPRREVLQPCRSVHPAKPIEPTVRALGQAVRRHHAWDNRSKQEGRYETA